jgi:hypothetical protein
MNRPTPSEEWDYQIGNPEDAGREQTAHPNSEFGRIYAETYARGAVASARDISRDAGVCLALAEASKDPDYAIRLGAQLADSKQAELYCRIATQVHPKDQSRASSLMDMAEERIKTTLDAQGRFDALVTCAQAAHDQMDTTRLQKAVHQAFDLGEELAEEDIEVHPQRCIYQTRTFSGMEQLSALDVALEPQEAVSHLQQLENDALRANLLAEAANVIEQTGQNLGAGSSKERSQ